MVASDESALWHDHHASRSGATPGQADVGKGYSGGLERAKASWVDDEQSLLFQSRRDLLAGEV
ncbi:MULTISPECIES: hypothetical protein [unclassified Ochrobactrum]|uniref:hypothetical protein n=1 Tax=unclassified Ochrobactrum TaxID=239106 RepID=UPI0030A2A484